MAIGVPRSSRRNPDTERTALPAIELSYSGKRTVEDILGTQRAPVELFSSGDTNKRLYFADNLDALSALATDKTICGKVKLVYIDPPFATQTVFHSRKLSHAYEDVFDSAEYIEYLRECLLYLREILADDGSIYLHIDDKMLFQLKLVMDEVFGAQNFRNCIVRKKCNPKNYTRKAFGNVADYILFYTKSDRYVWTRQTEPWTLERAKEYQYLEPETGRYFMKVPVHAPGIRNGETGKAWRGMMPPPGKHWQYPPAVLDEMDAKGEIFWSKNGNPRRKVYFDESTGIPVQDIWMDFRDAHNQNIHVTGYPTEKNLSLLKRIVQASSNPGDIVLDCFAGSGTTLFAADMLQRNWIGVDNSPEAIRTMLRRFTHGTEPMGDFVAKKDPAPPMPTLFQVVPSVEANPTLHHRIEGFSIFVTPETKAAAETVVVKR